MRRPPPTSYSSSRCSHRSGKRVISSLFLTLIYANVARVSLTLLYPFCCRHHNLYNSRGSNSFVIPENETVPALIVFGDSIVDPGNTDRLDTICRADHSPYGRDFEGGKATGRFSNAKIPTDYLAESLGIKDLLPAYLDPTIETEDLLTGVSFAFACCGYDPLTPQFFRVPSLQDQLEYFKEYKKKLIAAVGEERTSFIVSKSIYVVVAGSNDFTFTYNLFKLRKEMNMSSYTDLMISQASIILQALYDLGARRIGVVSLPPQGCLPATRTFFGGILRFCVEEYNYYSMVFNFKLQLLTLYLRGKNPDSRFVYLDLYNPVLRLVQNPTQSGINSGEFVLISFYVASIKRMERHVEMNSL
ncbi:GDSL esterase/lipase EXL3-like protein [Drosera capensis]